MRMEKTWELGVTSCYGNVGTYLLLFNEFMAVKEGVQVSNRHLIFYRQLIEG